MPSSVSETSGFGAAILRGRGRTQDSRAVSFLLSLSSLSPSSFTLLPLHPLSHVFHNTSGTRTMCLAQCWPGAHSSSQRRHGLRCLGKQTLHNILRYSVIPLQLCKVLRKWNFGGGGLRLPRWLSSKGFWCSLQITTPDIPRALLCVRPCTRHFR